MTVPCATVGNTHGAMNRLQHIISKLFYFSNMYSDMKFKKNSKYLNEINK